MEIILERLESERCYMKGKISINDFFICDCLEFNCEDSLSQGDYSVQILKEPITGNKRIYLFNENKKPVTKLTTENIYFINNIRIRKKNQFIEIGLLLNNYQLKMFEYINKLLTDKIVKATDMRDIVIFRILNTIEDDYYEAPVTSY